LRIEDIDQTRCRAEFTDGIYEDLSWLGFKWLTPPRVQSTHRQDYAAIICDLLSRGYAYPCSLRRSELKAGKLPNPVKRLTYTDDELDKWSDYSLQSLQSAPWKHVEDIKNIIYQANEQQNPSLPFTIRLDMRTALEDVSDYSLIYHTLTDGTNLNQGERLSAFGYLVEWLAVSGQPDPILARRDIGCSYHIAVTHDDHLQGVTHVVRGADFTAQTPLHVLIQHLMGWETPTYYHHALLTDPNGRKLSKSAKDLTIKSLRESGLSPEDVLSRAQ